MVDTMTIYEICVILLTIGTLIFFIYLIFTLRNLSEFLIRTDQHLHSIGGDLQSLMQESKGVAHSVNTKLNQLNPLFRVINDVSDTTEEKYLEFKKHGFSNFDYNRRKYREDVSDTVLKFAELATLVVGLWKRKK